MRTESGLYCGHGQCSQCRAAALTRACAWCATEFIATTTAQKYCSNHCNNIAKKKRRDAIKRAAGGESPSLGYIYERDGGRCALCGSLVDRRKKWPHRMSPSLDHIVPLSDGGRDDAANIQLAHLGCNQKKKNHRCGSQLRLVG